MPVIQKNAPSSSQAFIPRASLRTLFLWYWLPALLWGAVIATFSGAAFGYSHTQSILAKVVAILHIHLSGYQLFFLHNMIRKTAHFTVYGVLSALVFRAFRANWPTKRRWQFSWATLALSGMGTLDPCGASSDSTWPPDLQPTKGTETADLVCERAERHREMPHASARMAGS